MYFSFKFVKKKISKVTSKLDKKRSCQEHDLQVKWIKSNKDLFSQFIYHSFNSSLFSFNFFSSLKLADILPTRKKKNMSDIKNYPPVIIIPCVLGSMKDICMNECINTLIKFFLNIDTVFAEVIIHKIVCW